MAISRRQFVGLGAGAVCTFAFGGAVKAFGANGDLLRPPVVLDEDDFIAKCVRCNRCIGVCHTGALASATLEDGLLEIKTPKFDFHRGSCDFCNECVRVCPTAAITTCDPLAPSTGRIGCAVVVSDRCLAFYNGCDKCVQTCPYGALSTDGFGHPVVNEEKCNGCGVCENVCPALVYRTFSGGTMRGIVVAKDPQKFKAQLEAGEVNA